MSELTLYGFSISNYTWSARLALEEKGLAYALVPKDFTKPEFKQLNPFGKIPVLEWDGQRLYETTAIMAHLELAYPEPALVPSVAAEQVAMYQWLSSVNGEIQPALMRIVFERVVKPLRRMQTDESAIRDCLPRAEQVLSILDHRLLAVEYLAGGQCSQADLLLYPMCALLGRTPEAEALFAEKPGVAAWLQRMAQRPSVVATQP